MILRNRKGCMEVYKVFVDPLAIARRDSRRRARMSIQLATSLWLCQVQDSV